jgi:ABC-type dipeptide/oligopeptide/nickel transport system permease subunit
VIGFAVIVALSAPWIAPYDPENMDDIARRLAPPSAAHWLGNDLTGGDVLTGIIYGTRTSLYIGFVTVFLSITLGVSIGLLAGYRRGAIDMILMRTVDLLMAFPGILLAMALAALMGPDLHNVVLAITATGWTSSARLVRGQVLSLTEREYVTATRALGASGWRIVLKHIFPGTMSPLVVLATFSLSGVIIIEASLSFLGLGAQDGAPSWGAILSQGRTQLVEAPHLAVAPGVAIFLVVLALNFLGDALRDALDPRQGES